MQIKTNCKTSLYAMLITYFASQYILPGTMYTKCKQNNPPLLVVSMSGVLVQLA